MPEEKLPYILSEDYKEPYHVGEYYDVIEEAIEQMKGTSPTIRKKMKLKIKMLMKNCNRMAGRKVYSDGL